MERTLSKGADGGSGCGGDGVLVVKQILSSDDGVSNSVGSGDAGGTVTKQKRWWKNFTTIDTHQTTLCQT